MNGRSKKKTCRPKKKKYKEKENIKQIDKQENRIKINKKTLIRDSLLKNMKISQSRAHRYRPSTGPKKIHTRDLGSLSLSTVPPTGSNHEETRGVIARIK